MEKPTNYISKSTEKNTSLYLRFSDPKQIGGTSIGVQKEVCFSACKAEGYNIVDTVEYEAVSANKTNTQRVAELLDYCKQMQGKITILMVYKLDRFARSQEQHHWLRGQMLKMGILLRSATEKVDESPSGRLVEGVLAAVNEYDNEVKKERVKLSMWRRVDEGLWPWKPPLGYKVAKIEGVKLSPFVIDESCSSIVKDIFKNYSSGLISKSELARSLSKKVVKDYKGHAYTLSNQSIDNILNNIYYAGYLPHKDGRLVRGLHEPLIDIQIYEKCQQVQKKLSNNNIAKRAVNNPDFPLRKFASCGVCGTPLTACWSKGGGKEKHAYYYCRNNECSMYSKMIKKTDFENEFSDYLKEIKPTEDLIERFNKRFILRYQAREQEIKGDYLAQMKEIETLDLEEKNTIAMGGRGIIPEYRVKEQVDELERKIALKKSQLTEMHAEEMDINALLNYAHDFIRTVENTWSDALPNTKIRLQRFIFPNGVKYYYSGFSNAGLCPLFKQIKASASEESILVTPRRIELRLPG